MLRENTIQQLGVEGRVDRAVGCDWPVRETVRVMGVGIRARESEWPGRSPLPFLLQVRACAKLG